MKLPIWRPRTHQSRWPNRSPPGPCSWLAEWSPNAPMRRARPATAATHLPLEVEPAWRPLRELSAATQPARVGLHGADQPVPKRPKRPRRKCRAPKHDVLSALSRRMRSSGRLVRTRCEVWPRARICSRSRRRNRSTSPSDRRLGRPQESAFCSETRAHLRVSGRVSAGHFSATRTRPARSAVDFGPKRRFRPVPAPSEAHYARRTGRGPR